MSQSMYRSVRQLHHVENRQVQSKNMYLLDEHTYTPRQHPDIWGHYGTAGSGHNMAQLPEIRLMAKFSEHYTPGIETGK